MANNLLYGEGRGGGGGAKLACRGVGEDVEA